MGDTVGGGLRSKSLRYAGDRFLTVAVPIGVAAASIDGAAS